MPHIIKEYNITPGDFMQAGEGSIQVKKILNSLGFEQAMVRRVSVCAYESEMNVVMHGGPGQLSLTVDDTGIILDVMDDGPGILDVDLALKEGYSTALKEHQEMGFGAGMGLPNIRKNADSFEIITRQGEGTHLKMKFRKDG